MFNPDNINEKYFKEYVKFIDLLKRKGPTPDKYPELREILKFFSENQDNMNSDELKILKNVLIMTNDILNRATPNKKIQKEQKEECNQLFISIKNKNLQR